MSFVKQIGNRQLFLLLLAATALFGIIQITNLCSESAYYFQSSLRENILWFPHAFPLTWLFFHGFFVLVYACWLYGMLILWLPWSTSHRIVVITCQACLVLWLQSYGFYVVSCYAPFLASMLLFFTYKQKISLVYISRILTTCFLFALYIILCLILPRFHPFAKYTMFNKFPETTYAYLLRDENNQLIPLEQFSNLKNDYLYTTSVAINTAHGFAYGKNNENPFEEKEMSNELVSHYFKNLKTGTLPFDSVKLCKATFTLRNNKLVMNEKLLGTYKAH